MSKRNRQTAALSPDQSITSALVRKQLQKILRSPEFVHSDRMSRFLRFVVGEALAGRAGDLKEYGIGLEVFDRPSSYDPRTEPIVRVEARRLRAKLESYYQGEGRSDHVVIELPKGHYAPAFRQANPEEPKRQTGTDDENTIAVLPFNNLSADPENEYFSDGLTEELIHALTKVEGLRVVAWSSALQFKGKPTDVYEVGRRLKVSKVLEGSVRRSRDRLRITVQLVNTANGYYLWSETYNRQMKDWFDIQDEISQSIADVMRVRLTTGKVAIQVRRGEKELEAYNLYLKGRHFWNKRTYNGMIKSIECYEQALEADNTCALSFAGIADSYCVLAHYGLASPKAFVPRARAAAMKALEIDNSLAEANVSLAMIRSLYDWEWTDAERHYKRAIELNPGYAVARLWYGIDFLALLGRMDEAFGQLALASQLDPLTPICKETDGYIKVLARRYEEAVVSYKKLIAEEPTFYKAYTSLGRAYSLMGRYDQAIASLEKGRELGGGVPNIYGALGQTYGLAGKIKEAQRLQADLRDLAQKKYVTCSCFALIHLGLREKQEALDWLEKGCERRELTLAALNVHPAYDDLRSEPRFREILRRIGLGS